MFLIFTNKIENSHFQNYFQITIYSKNYIVLWFLFQNGRLVTFITGSLNRTLTCSCVGCFPNVTFTWSREIEPSSEKFELLTSENNSFTTRILYHKDMLNR